MRLLSILLLAVAAAFTAAPVAARAEGRSSELRCTQASGFGFLVTSQRKVTCVYYRPDGAVEFYTGAIDTLGFDGGPTNAVGLAFLVRVPGPITTGALDGGFVGAGAQVTLGSGFGADALIGGTTGQAVLLPIRNVSLTGLNLNVALARLRLDYRGMERHRDD